MTKEELLEDVKIGDLVKIYTRSDETFEGKVVDFGESGLKMTVLNTNKAKRIIYERITEYDIEDVVEETLSISNTESTVAEGISEKIVEKTVNTIKEDTQALEQRPIIIEYLADKIDRKSIFGDIDTDIVLESIKEEWIAKLDAKQKKEYIRISNSLDYARKVHEYSLNSDRVKRAVSEYKKLAVDIKLMNIFIALIYHEFGDTKNAIGYYHEGGAYDVEFQLSLKYDYDDEYDLFEKAILAVEYNSENISVLKWLCEYAVKKNDFSVICHMVKHSNTYMCRVLLYWYIDKPEIDMIPDKKNLFSDSNAIYLKNINSVKDGVNANHIKAVLSKFVNASDETENTVIKTQDDLYNGVISYYDKNKRYGTIKNNDGESIYFYIKQVKDLELQKILATEENYKRRVTYIRGINFKGEIAADAIELDIADDTIKETEYKYEGYFDYYDTYNEGGKIRSGKKTFNFVFDDIKDPLLYAEIKSRPFLVLEELTIKFNVKEYKSKKTNKKSKIAYNICGLKEYSQQEIKEFISQKLIAKEEVDEWLGIISKKNTDSFTEVDYEPLQPIDSVVRKEVISDQILVQTNANANKYMNLRSGENKAVSLVLDDKIENPFMNMKIDINGKKYFQEAHKFMVGRKNSSGETIGVDLDRAEELFIRSIRARDQTNSSVANLVNIYIKRGGDYITTGLQLLEEYGYLFQPEKLTNLRIQLIDKSGNIEALEQILLSAIPNCAKRNTVWQYMAKLAGLYYKQQKWDDAINWFEKSLSYLDKNKNYFPQYQLLRNNNLRPLIIAKYTIGNKREAIEQAKEVLRFVPEDQVIKSIIEGTFESNKTIKVLEDIEDIELRYEDDLFDATNSEMSLFLNDKLERVDLSSTFSKVTIVYDKLDGGRYMGNADDSIKAVEAINKNLKNKRGINAEIRSAIFIGIARIILDSRENSNSSNEDKVAVDEVKRYVAKYARYYADVLVEKYATVDSIRFLYIQALRYLRADDRGNIIVATNMLIASFFVDPTKLPDELHDMENSAYKDDYYKMNCLSTKDLLIASFMLKDRQEYVKVILEKIDKEPLLRSEVVKRLNKILESDKKVTDYHGLDEIWKKAKASYYSNLEQLDKEISDSINEYHMVERIRIHSQRIRDILKIELLWNQDESVIQNYLKLIGRMNCTLCQGHFELV